MAIMVPTRLWLGVVSPKRDKMLIQQLGEQIRAIALCRPLLLAVDGLASYVSVFQGIFRSPLPCFGQVGRPPTGRMAEDRHCPGCQATDGRNIAH